MLSKFQLIFVFGLLVIAQVEAKPQVKPVDPQQIIDQLSSKAGNLVQQETESTPAVPETPSTEGGSNTTATETTTTPGDQPSTTTGATIPPAPQTSSMTPPTTTTKPTPKPSSEETPVSFVTLNGPTLIVQQMAFFAMSALVFLI